MARAFAAVGSNINPQENIVRALRLLAQRSRLAGISTFYQTAAIGQKDQPAFYNGVVEIGTDMEARRVKWELLRGIETELGRVRTGDRHAPRAIDLDLLLYDQLVVNQEGLVLPDPDVYVRAFVAVPLWELAGELVMPDTQEPIGDIARRLDTASMQRLEDYTRRLRTHLSGGE